MQRKDKISYEIKIKFIKEYLDGNIPQNGIAKELGLHISSIKEWIRKYKILGQEVLITILVLCQYIGHEKLNFFMINFYLIIHINLESYN